MVTQGKGIHHMNVRKRIYEKKEKYPHPNKLKRRYDKFMYVIAILGPIMTLPQLLKIWISHDSSGVSIISWAGFAIMAGFWGYYGILHREKQLIIMYFALLILQALVVIGAIIY